MSRYGARTRASTSISSWLSTSGFNPSSLSPLVWLDASDETTVNAVSNKVTQWDDKSGNGNHFSQSVSANQPSTAGSTKNGRNVLTFDGNDVLTRSTITAAAGFTIACAVMPTSITTDPTIYQGNIVIGAYTGGAVADISLGFRTSAASLYAESGTGGLEARAGTASANNWYVLSGYADRIQLVARLNGTAGSSAGTARNALIINGVGAGSGGGTYFSGSIGEIIVFDGILSAGNLELVEGWLNSRWAVY